MTPKQQERIKNKIKKIKAALAADKKFWGGQYHDGRGLRYLPPQYYLELNDFTGGLRYFNWFNKIFPDDSGHSQFLLEWTIVLFKTGRQKEAEKKAFQTFCCNTYVFDIFFGRPVIQRDKFESTTQGTNNPQDYRLSYSADHDVLKDFSDWLDKFLASEKFILLSNKFLEIEKRLTTENDFEIRHYLILQRAQLENEW